MCLMVCRVENSEANRLRGLPDVAIITCQLRQEIQLTYARKSNASFKCHLAQMHLCKLLNEARQASRDMLCGIYTTADVSCWVLVAFG